MGEQKPRAPGAATSWKEIRDLTCPTCGNLTRFVEHALLWSKQHFTVPESGRYLDAEWGAFDHVDETVALEILCAECNEIIWQHPRLDEIEALIEEEGAAP